MIPYADITETADRRWTSRLTERLVAPDLPDDELDNLVWALQTVSDPRSVVSLEAVLIDLSRPAWIREAADAVLGGMQYLTIDVPKEKLRRWWRKGDAILRRHALSCMDRIDCPDIVLAVAGDPTHKFHAESIGRMLFFFDLPEHQQVKIAGLSHVDAKVREAAACVLLWDEPVAAEGPLLQATGDPVPGVVAEAANTLEYYPSLRVVRRLHELLGHPDDRVREAVDDSYASIRNELLIPLCGEDRQTADHIRRWLRPVWDVLAFTEEEIHPDKDENTTEEELRPDKDKNTTARQEEQGEATPLADLLALLADPDASPRTLTELLWSNHWLGYRKEERRLRPVLLTHPDLLVRERAALAFAAWQDTSGLLGLVHDQHFLVRKSAVYQLGQLPPTPEVAAFAWDYLHRLEVLGFHATETLDTFVKHAEPAVAVRRLGWIAGDHGRREGLRVSAVHHLANLGAAKAVGQLAGLLLDPPEVTWALHIALLAAVTDLDLPRPDVGPFREVDNLHVQAAVARAR